MPSADLDVYLTEAVRSVFMAKPWLVGWLNPAQIRRLKATVPDPQGRVHVVLDHFEVCTIDLRGPGRAFVEVSTIDLRQPGRGAAPSRRRN